MDILDNTIYQAHEWARMRIDLLTKEGNTDDAFSIVQEFSEWLDSKDEDQDVYSLEYIGEDSEYS